MSARAAQRLAAIAAMCLVLAVSLAALGIPAESDEPPQSRPPNQMAGFDGPTHLVTDKSGGVTAGCDRSGWTKTFAYSGAATRTLASPQATSTCPGESIVGKDGSLYAHMSDATGNYLVAYRKSTLTWRYKLPCALGALALGTNGNVYAAASNNGANGICAKPRLIGLSPSVVADTSAPKLLVNAALRQNMQFGGLAAHNGGLVVQYTDGVQYVAYSGAAGTFRAVPTVRSYDTQFEATPSGRTFVFRRANQAARQSCQDDNIVASIDAYTASGRAWSYALPSCSYAHALKPTPGGGFVLYLASRQSDLPGTTLTERLIAVASNGKTLLWQQDLPRQGSDNLFTYNGAAFSVDLNGDVLLQRSFKQYDNDGHIWPGVGLQLLSGNTGIVFGTYRFAGDPGDNSQAGRGYLATNNEVAIAKGVAYVTALRCDTWGNCGGDPSLYAVRIPGLQLDYPRGVTFGAVQPGAAYVALGDSFSAGEGVPPFLNGTDVGGASENRCHRSQNAYARLLTQSVARPLKLQAFVACSGATTAHITRKWQPSDFNPPKNANLNEAPQINALNAETKLVTITIGGNDVGFVDFATACVTPTVGCSGAAYIDISSKIRYDLPAKLRKALTTIRGRTRAKTYVLGYPKLVLDPSINAPVSCLYLRPREREAALNAVTQLNEKLEAAVKEANNVQLNHQFTYVDPNAAGSPFTGHELCTDDSYFNNVDILHREYSIHPNRKGQDAYRRLLQAYFG